MPINRNRSTVISCGVDVVNILSFTRSVNATDGRMLEVCFTPAEQEDAGGCMTLLASKWAVKEAVVKALGTGFLRGVGFHDIEVTTATHGATTVSLSGAALQVANDERPRSWVIAVSNDAASVIGIALGIGEGGK